MVWEATKWNVMDNYMSLSLNSSNELCEWVLPGFFIMFLSTYEPLLCFFQVCCSVAEIITKSVQFVPTVSWGCRYPPYNTVSCGDLKCHCSGIAFTERTPSCNWAFYNQFQVGRERVEYDVPLFHQSCSLYGKSSSWGEKSDVSTTRNVYEKKFILNMNR